MKNGKSLTDEAIIEKLVRYMLKFTAETFNSVSPPLPLVTQTGWTFKGLPSSTLPDSDFSYKSPNPTAEAELLRPLAKKLLHNGQPITLITKESSGVDLMVQFTREANKIFTRESRAFPVLH